MPLKPGLEVHIETPVMEAASMIGRRPNMQHYPQAFIENVIRELAYMARPDVELIKQEKSLFIFKVISPPIASNVGCWLGNDTNSHLHTGDDATTQSNALIGICTAVVMRTLGEEGGELTLVKPLNFRNPLPRGMPVLVTIEITRHGKSPAGTIEVVTEEGRKTIMRKAIILMVRG